MKIVVDTNRIIAALVKSGTTRDILFEDTFEFLTPDYAITEISNHKDLLLKKTKLTKEKFELLLTLLFENVEVVPSSEYGEFLEECKEDISDPDDIPFLAVAVSHKADGIWTHDTHFSEQNKIKVFTNIQMLEFSRALK